MAIDIDAQGLALAARTSAAAAIGQLVEKASSNLAPALLAPWNRAKARVRAGLADAVVAVVGDSTTVGHGAGDGATANFNGARPRATPARIAQQLVAMGLPATADAVFGGNMIDTQNASLTKLVLYNPQLAIASNAKADWYCASGFSLGAAYFENDTGIGAITLTPAASFDTIDLFTLDVTGNDTLSVAVGGAGIGTIATGAPPGGATRITRTTLALAQPVAAQPIAVSRTGAGGKAVLLGMIPRNSAARRVQLLNLGWEGAQTGDWASDPGSATYVTGLSTTGAWRPTAALTTLAPDLTIINLGLNDMAHATPVARSMANLAAIVAAARAGGGAVILVVPHPQDPTSRDPAGLAASYNAGVKALAQSAGCGVIDLYGRYGSFAAANTLGYYADAVHMLPVGYAHSADVIARALFGS